MIKKSTDHCCSLFSFSENRSSTQNTRMPANHTHPTLRYPAKREYGERRGQVTSSLRRPHWKFPTHWQKEHPAVGPQPLLGCTLPRWLWSLIPSRLGMQSLCPCFFTIVSDQVHYGAHPAKNNASQVYGDGFPPDYLQRSLKDPILYECGAFSLLFYSIRRVFFCSPQAPGFNFWNIEFRLLLPSFPRLLKLVAIFNYSPHPLFFSWSWWIWICKSFVAASIFFF